MPAYLSVTQSHTDDLVCECDCICGGVTMPEPEKIVTVRKFGKSSHGMTFEVLTRVGVQWRA